MKKFLTSAKQPWLFGLAAGTLTCLSTGWFMICVTAQKAAWWNSIYLFVMLYLISFVLALRGIRSVLGVVAILFALVPLVVVSIFAFGHTSAPQGRLGKDVKEFNAASTEEDKFYALNDMAKENFGAGKVGDARKNATDLLSLAPKFQGNWNYGNAIQDGNLVLGRIASKEGRMEEAKQYLLEAGKSPGSPQMDSFGPNMSLANDLLEKGERETVLQYFDLCRKFWEDGNDKLDRWTKEVKAGDMPDFGANLVY